MGLSRDRAVKDGPAPGRWGLAVAVGAFVGIPTGVLLAYVAFIFALLGLFFYVLFGLILGAIVFRVAGRPGRVPRGAARLGVAVVVAITWGTSLYWEYHASPAELADQAVHTVHALPKNFSSRAAYEAYVMERARALLAEQYPPGGWIGYMWWMAASGRMPRGTIEGVETTIGPDQRRYLWMIRIGLSLILLTFGVSALIPREKRRVSSRSSGSADDVGGKMIEKSGEGPIEPSSRGAAPSSL